MSQDSYDQYKTLCAECECVLGIDVAIECLVNEEGEEMDLCWSCWSDYEDEWREEGWITSEENYEFEQYMAEEEKKKAAQVALTERLDAALDEMDDDAKMHLCKTCNEWMTDANFQKGKMCCDKPMFGDDHDEEEEEEEECEERGGPCVLCGNESSCWNYNWEHQILCEACLSAAITEVAKNGGYELPTIFSGCQNDEDVIRCIDEERKALGITGKEDTDSK